MGGSQKRGILFGVNIMNKRLTLDMALNKINSNVITMNEALRNINDEYDMIHQMYLNEELTLEEFRDFVANIPPVDFSENHYEKRYNND